MIHQTRNVWCIFVLAVLEQTCQINFRKRSSVTLILIFNFINHNGKLQTASLVAVTSTCEEYKDTLISAINVITKHLFLAKCQANFLRAKKESLKANEVNVFENFAENYQFLVQDEIQSYHWSKEYCTLLSLVLYFIDSDRNIHHNSLYFTSDDDNHNTNFVYKIQTILVDYC